MTYINPLDIIIKKTCLEKTSLPSSLPNVKKFFSLGKGWSTFSEEAEGRNLTIIYLSLKGLKRLFLSIGLENIKKIMEAD